MKSNKGITLITLVITMIILLILGGISLTVGNNMIEETQDKKLVSELNMVQHAILEQYAKYQTTKDTSYIKVGNRMELADVKDIARNMGIELVNIPDNYSNKDYYKLDKLSLLKMGIENTEDEYIVNYISGEVINNTKKHTNDNKALYVRANSFYNE
jgi:type II secretory pathway pseudopilin PulG